MRLFLGLPWPIGTANLESRAQVWADRDELRLVRQQNWHVTLRFLGETPEHRIGELAGLLERWARTQHSMTFVDRGWGVFGSPEAPRVIILKLEALPVAQKAVGQLHKALDEAGFAGDGKPWKPHLTLAYGKGGHPGPWPEEALGGRPSVIFRRAVLYQSQLGPGGSDYRELVSVPLPDASPH